MLHVALHARPGQWLFHDHLEAQALWERLVGLGPVHQLCLMPDHVHLFALRVAAAMLRGAMSGHTRWLAHRRDQPGLRLWRGYDPPEPITSPEHLQRTRRYVLLNPCRGRLVDDPLAWPWSTHRDAVGLAWPRARKVVSDPVDFHAYVSRDRSVDPGGTDLPVHGLYLAAPSFEQVEAAVSAVTRTPIVQLRTAPLHRRRLIRCLRCHTDLSVRAIARRLGVSPGLVGGIPAQWDELARVVERVLGDDRFPGLAPGDLRCTVMWDRYELYLAAKARGRRRLRAG
jgi:hypothetical protein